MERIEKFVVGQSVSKRVFDYDPTMNQHTCIRVLPGLIEQGLPAEVIPSANAHSPIFLFTDPTVYQLYGANLLERLATAGYDIHLVILPEGEEAKSMANYVYLVDRVLGLGVDEGSLFISLGGGVVCNTCGFVASTIYRGLDLIHLPTTLLAQCDAAISHKQGINGRMGKNLLGTYYPPQKVLVDPAVLRTLPRRELTAGMAEVIKHAVGQSRELFDWLWDYDGDVADQRFLTQVIEHAIALKCELVRDDPKEERGAMVLQLGHTAGHPIEHLSGYQLNHGEAVAVGMVFAAWVSVMMGLCKPGVVHRTVGLLQRYGLPTRMPGTISWARFEKALCTNKKFRARTTRMALLSNIGKLATLAGETPIGVGNDVLAASFTGVQPQNRTGTTQRICVARNANKLVSRPAAQAGLGTGEAVQVA